MFKFDENQGLQLRTPQEVDHLIPELERLLDHIQHCQKRAEVLTDTLRRERAEGRLSIAEDQLLRSQIEFLLSATQEAIDNIMDLGGVIKDIQEGLVDFLGQVNEKEVWLCWKKGEVHIQHWHTLDSGFSSRKQLPRTDISTSIH